MFISLFQNKLYPKVTRFAFARLGNTKNYYTINVIKAFRVAWVVIHGFL